MTQTRMTSLTTQHRLHSKLLVRPSRQALRQHWLNLHHLYQSPFLYLCPNQCQWNNHNKCLDSRQLLFRCLRHSQWVRHIHHHNQFQCRHLDHSLSQCSHCQANLQHLCQYNHQLPCLYSHQHQCQSTQDRHLHLSQYSHCLANHQHQCLWALRT